MAGCSKKNSGKPAGVKKLSICGNCYFILTLLGVCHETVAFYCPIKAAMSYLNCINQCSADINCICSRVAANCSRDPTCVVCQRLKEQVMCSRGALVGT